MSRELHRHRADNSDLGYTALTPCSGCGVPVSMPAHRRSTLCLVCQNNLRAHPEWAGSHAGQAFTQPSAASPASDDCGAVPVTALRASFGMVDNLVVAIGLTLLCCIVITLAG